jgi:hypothetical protein
MSRLDIVGEVVITDRHRWAFDAFMAAIDRQQLRRRTRDQDATGAALAEVLWWAVALIDRLDGNAYWESILAQPRQSPHTGTERDHVRGVRWARHRVGHQLVDALVIRDGYILPTAPPMAGFEYCWRSLHELPPADPNHI